MQSFAYQGDHAEVTLYGVTFPQGVLVPVENETLIAKLQGNSHFSTDVQAATDQEPAPARRGRKPKAS